MPRRLPDLGHDLIDRQHRRLDALTRRLHAALAAGRPARALLTRLLRDTRRHFASEERLMRAAGYPEQRGHVALHDGVVSDMLRIRRLLAAGLPVHRKEAARLNEWLEHHVSEADRNLVAYLGRRGRRPAAH